MALRWVFALSLGACAGPRDDDDTVDAPTDDSDVTLPEPVATSLAGARAKLLGEAEGDWAGRQVGAGGDVDGDGFADVVVTALWHDGAGEDAGAVYVARGPIEGEWTLDQATARLLGEASHDAAGVSAVGAGDLDGDGFDDLVVGADGHDRPLANAGAIYVVAGPMAGTIPLGEAAAKLVGEARGDLAGVSVAGAGDLDGDGRDDLLVGARYHDQGGDDSGSVYVVYGPITTGSLGTAGAELVGERPGDWVGITVSGAGDLDGDGRPEVTVGARYHDGGGEDSGAAYVAGGPLAGALSLGDAQARLVGEAAGDDASHVAGGGDLDGDGLDDLVVGAPSHDAGGRDRGAVYVVPGPVAGELPLGAVVAKLVGDRDGGLAGARVGVAGDVDADGVDDLVVGAWNPEAATPDEGRAYLVFGPILAPADLGAAGRVWVGEAPGDLLGCSVGGAGDVDGDGHDDVLVSACNADATGTDSGAAWLMAGGER